MCQMCWVMVKIKAKEYAFYEFMETKEKHSKMKDLWYFDLCLQHYFKQGANNSIRGKNFVQLQNTLGQVQ